MLQPSDMGETRSAKVARPAKGGPGDRRCIVTRASAPRGGLLRFVVGPEGAIVPDLAEQLPGRGIWVTATAEMVEAARRKNLFGRVAGRAVSVPADLVRTLEQLLAARTIALIGLARRANRLIVGRDRVREAMGRGGIGVLIVASGTEPIEPRNAASPSAAPRFAVLSAAEIGAAIGREAAAMVGVAPGRLADSLAQALTRLAGFRGAAARDAAPPAQRDPGAARTNTQKGNGHG